SNPAQMIDVARFLGRTGRASEAITVLGQAEALGAPRSEILLTRAELQLKSGDHSGAESSLSALRGLNVDDPRYTVLEAQAMLASGAPDAPDRAIGKLDGAAIRYPGDVEIQRLRVELVGRYQKWGAAARALEGYKQALYARDGVATDAHLAAARI